MLRVHFLTPNTREVYFEISNYDSLPAVSEFRQHTENLKELLQTLHITELSTTHCASLPAFQYGFKCKQGVRTVILVEHGKATYRILFDPVQSVNLKILSTLRWLEAD
jgi:hypothetical protein